MKRSKVILPILLIVCLLLGVLIGYLIFALNPSGGLGKGKDIEIESYYDSNIRFSLPIEYNMGYKKPDMALFDSDLNITELAEKVSIIDSDEYTCECDIYGDKAIIYAVNNGVRKGFVIMYKTASPTEDIGQQYYRMTNGAVSIGANRIPIPLHYIKDITVIGDSDGKIIFADSVTTDMIADFYRAVEYFEVSVSGNTIMLECDDKGKAYTTVKITMDTVSSLAEYTFT